MALAKVIEVIAEGKTIELAVDAAVKEASDYCQEYQKYLY